MMTRQDGASGVTSDNPLSTPLARHIWESRYRANESERSIEASWQRMARALSSTEASGKAGWHERFYDALKGFQFVPGGRIQAGIGTGMDVTLFNCFVMGVIEDTGPGMLRALRECAQTVERGGGVGYDFSTVRPAGSQSSESCALSAGPVAAIDLWDRRCGGTATHKARRSAMMATLRCDHPDIEAFIEAKSIWGRLPHFGLSVQITDAFMSAVARDQPWSLVFPAEGLAGEGETVLRNWPGKRAPTLSRIVRRVSARGLWEKLKRAAYDTGNPGVLFVDRINLQNNLWYCEEITATNPCGEEPLPAYGACDLGSINLARLIRDPFTRAARLDRDRLGVLVAAAVRMLDNVIDISAYPLPEQTQMAHRARRVGLGIMGLADALIMLGLNYGSDAALDFAGSTMRSICLEAYRQSIALSEQKGCFPAFQRDRYLQGTFIRSLPSLIRDQIARHGIRNSHLLAIAPTGTISLLAGNVSSGIEPVFAADYDRSVVDADGRIRIFRVTDDAVARWRAQMGVGAGVPPAMASVPDISIEAHIGMQSALQAHVDGAIAKTINVPEATGFETFATIYDLAYARGLKGCTAFRPSAGRSGILAQIPAGLSGCTNDCSELS